MKNPPGEDDNEAASSMTMLLGLKMPGLLTRFLSRVKAEGRLTLVLEICKWECQAQVKSRSSLVWVRSDTLQPLSRLALLFSSLSTM